LKTPQVVVVGAGAAGTAAALCCANSGARVVVLDGGTGASTLSTGAVDVDSWAQRDGPPRDVPTAARAALDVLGGYVLPREGALLLTTAGIARPADGHDAALLDVGPFATGRVGVVACARPGWDAHGLARAWGPAFAPLDAAALRHTDEAVVPDADFAAIHDDETRLGWLASRLREAIARAGGPWAALVLPPALGVEHARAAVLSKLVGVPCGEAIGMPGGPSGLRFERARERAFRQSGVTRVGVRAMQVDPTLGRWRVRTDDGASTEADAVVIAVGGLIGGGVEYAPAEAILATALPPSGRLTLRLSLLAPVTLGAHGCPLESPSSLFGQAPEVIAHPFASDPLLERAGVLVAQDGAIAGAPGLFAAGEVVADAPHEWLSAFVAGAAAGRAACVRRS
jgi:glycerol-3-phosphate dehydrogenase subunit B